jgi:hypothetical protein
VARLRRGGTARRLANSATPPRRSPPTRRRTDDNDKRDVERAKAERLLDKGETVVAIGWNGGGKTVEREAGPAPSNKGSDVGRGLTKFAARDSAVQR